MRARIALLLAMLMVLSQVSGVVASPIERLSLPDEEQERRYPLIFRFGEHERNYKNEATYPLPSCDGMSVASTRLCLLMRNARRIAQETPLEIYVPRGSREIWREFVLVAYDELEQRFHPVIFEIPVAEKAGLRTRIKTAGYAFERLRGTSLNQMTFRIWFEDRELRVLGAKYIVVPKEVWKAPLLIMRTFAEEVPYLAVPEYLNTPEFCAKGMDFAKTHIEGVLANLNRRGVRSLADPRKLVGEIIHPFHLLALIGIEQSGEEELFGRGFENFSNGKHDVREFCRVYSTYMLNGIVAFRYVCSGAPACGPFQFTDLPGSRTYSTMRKKYPLANLDPKFTRGTGTFYNAAMAAALLLDHERSNTNIAALLRDLRSVDPLLEEFFPIAAYNGGASQAIHLATLYLRYRKEHGREMRSLDMPWGWGPFADSAKRYRPVKGEFFPQTVRYIRKYQLISDMLLRVYGTRDHLKGIHQVWAGQ
jgi:hypothetical protein